MINATSRQRLEVIRERTKNARSQRTRARQQLDAARDLGDLDAQAVAQISFDQADDDLQIAERLENQLLSSLSGFDGNGSAAGIFDDPTTVETLGRLGSSSFPIGNVDLGPLSGRDELVEKINTGSWGQPKLAVGTDVTVPDSARVGTYLGTVPQPRRPLSILDLIPTSTMDGQSFGYLQESGTYSAVEVAEGVVKPEGGVTLTEAEVTAATVAVWLKLRRQTLADVPTLSQTINDRLVFDCLRRLEGQILAGDGVGENILGITRQSGIGSIAFNATPPLTDLTLDGITAVLMSDAIPDAVVLNPVDWSSMLKKTATGSGQRLDSGGAFSAQPATLWGLPAIASKAITQGTALVGAFGTACRLFVREPVNVRVSDADQDDFVRNRVTTLAELRAGLAVWQPTGFALIDLAA